MNSIVELEDLKKRLSALSKDFESVYTKLSNNYNGEQKAVDEYTARYNEKLEKYYDTTSNMDLAKMIQDRLPAILKLFRIKVYIKGKCLDKDDSCIRVQYNFDWRNYGFKRFFYEFWVNDFE